MQIAIRYGLKIFLVDFSGPFARLGSHPKCEIQVPFGQNSVLAYLQVAKGGLAVVALPPEGSHRCRTQFVGTGGSLSLTSPITISVVSLELKETEKVLPGISTTISPDALLLEESLVKGGLANARFLVASGISILGSSQACQLRLKHRKVAPYQCAIIRSTGRFPSMRIVDLLSHHPTTIGGQLAQGQELGIKDILSIGKMVFVAKRLIDESVQLPNPERDLMCSNETDLDELQTNEFHQEVEITNGRSLTEIVSTQQAESRSEDENQRLLKEMSRSMASLDARIEKIESTLGFLQLQIAAEGLPRNCDDSSHVLETVDQASDSIKPISYVESPAETYMLGQLIELRTRDDYRHKSKLILAAITCFVLSVFVIATMWHQIPSGWKERIWQYCAFTTS